MGWFGRRSDLPCLPTVGRARIYLRQHLDRRPHERFVTLMLRNAAQVVGQRIVDGQCDRIELPLRAIMRDAVRLEADGLILAHNHPSGSVRPSAEDVEATRRFIAWGRPGGIAVIDHFIFADGECFSFRQAGLL